MSSGSCVDRQNSDHCSNPRGFLTPPPTWKMNRKSPVMPRTEMKAKPSPQQKGDMFHIIHKIPSGNSPYVKAKHVQLVEKDLSRAISLFWAAINAGDRVDSALKDMAVVMKQVNRSDEAIEAIKSFRHLSPPESQESLDNILVELYKQSGRIEEEIELLQHKLKLVEEGMAFCGRKTKIARSQGKKIQITVQNEYSRLLGNLAWAYMQHQDYKSAEEHYRKALSFEADKNKQCNLAICLMHTNKLNEAKFLLETIPSGNGDVEESYAKSYERASEVLAEFEAQLKPTKQTEQSNDVHKTKPFGGQWNSRIIPQPSPLPSAANNGPITDFPYEKRGDFDWRTNRYGCLNKAKPFGQQWNSRFCSQKHSNDGNATQLPSWPLPTKVNNGPFTDSAYKKRADFNWRTKHYEPTRWDGVFPPYADTEKVPVTQPRRCPRSGDQSKHGLPESGQGSYCRKLYFESSSNSSDTDHSLASQNVNCSAFNAPDEVPKMIPHFLEKRNSSNEEGIKNDCRRCAIKECDLPSESTFDSRKVEEDSSQSCNMNLEARCERIPTHGHKMSWADMVEEEEQDEFGGWKSDHQQTVLDKFSVVSLNQESFNDENVDSNIIPETPKLHDVAEIVSEEMGSIDLGGGYLTQPEKKSKNQPLRRSLCFDQNHTPLTTKAMDFEGQGGGDDLGFSKPKNRRRLQVFEDITRFHESPRA